MVLTFIISQFIRGRQVIEDDVHQIIHIRFADKLIGVMRLPNHLLQVEGIPGRAIDPEGIVKFEFKSVKPLIVRALESQVVIHIIPVCIGIPIGSVFIDNDSISGGNVEGSVPYLKYGLALDYEK